MIIIQLIFVMAILTLIWMFLGYPVALFVINKIKSNPVDKAPPTLKVTVLICTYQEANVIERRLENILQSDYPLEQMEILIVDSSSPDGTCDVVDRFCGAHPLAPIRMICEDNRRGKVSAINIGLSSAHGEIIILTDGPALFWPDTIRFVIENFNDPKVG